MDKLTKQELQEMTVVYGNRHNVCRAAKELLSLREQLAALKAFISNECFIIDPEDDENCIRAEYHTKYAELFTAAKPS